MIPEHILKEVKLLQLAGYSVDLIESDGFANLILQDYHLPPLYCKSSTTLLVRLPMSYPNGKPDMFWTDEDLVLANGQEPNKANVFETIVGRKWRRFSWHPQNWHPASGNLHMYLEFINTGLTKATK